ncbi:hypothetical protein E3E36_02085 [Thermococcus sp. M36]|uniref:hypothetical protein n=1 Tax=Thermococcus sp. M36 TaxID=1638261 RepID=UPI00143AAE91|nr:hypothetical protein [Thermococcus sp. M36]NJE04957.1 hypothetical protein [Thermococcus sp. M36]
MDKDLKIVIPFVIVFILLVQIAQMHYEIRELRGELESLKDQQEQFSRIIWEEYRRDIYAAIDHLRETRPDIMEKLGNVSLTVGSIFSWSFEADYDPKKGVFWMWHNLNGWKERDVVYVRVSAYYPSNGSRVPGFPWITYRINHTTGEVLGITEDTAQAAVMRAYWKLFDNISATLRIDQNESRGRCGGSVGSVADKGIWLHVEFECVSAENTSLRWLIMGEVDERTGVLKRLEITKPFPGSCERDDELRIRELLDKIPFRNATVEGIKQKITDTAGGLIFNLTFPNP